LDQHGRCLVWNSDPPLDPTGLFQEHFLAFRPGIGIDRLALLLGMQRGNARKQDKDRKRAKNEAGS
jgi:hypothetical protein